MSICVRLGRPEWYILRTTRPGCLEVLRGDSQCCVLPSLGLAGTPEIKFLLGGRKCRRLAPRSPSLLSWLRQVIRGAVYDVERKREREVPSLSLSLSLFIVYT